MKHFIKELQINNFKSIKDVKLDCSRINLIVGKPNVGKSNVLEALSLFCTPYSKNKDKFLSEFIRYNQLEELFFDSEIQLPISIKSNLGEAIISSKKEIFQLLLGQSDLFLSYFKNNHFDFESFNRENLAELGILFSMYELSADGKIEYEHKQHEIDHIKKYIFKKPSFSDLNGGVLMTPYGENLFSAVLTHSKLRQEIGEWLKEYRLDLVVDKRTKSLAVQKREGNIVYPIAYNLIADTLQRIIFHYAAVESNKNSILLFEEPESHAFPPYIYELANKIRSDEKNNQYFITTHSPYLFNSIVENTPTEEVSVFLANYKDYQTTIKKLTIEELQELLDYGIDIFFNTKYFTNG